MRFRLRLRNAPFFGALVTDVVERVVAALATDRVEPMRAVGLVDRSVDRVDVDEEERDMM